ncbi:hypothetical protein RRG08_038608 [Elysia crispata]|uniref:Uncharacterized protein n=1 Tax=Elysia crispata TaxID=231223 RepID=A0AAE1ASG9_9GAST|nr:hypothetical protein RRG08_038608 [Elysia crispata]
MSRAVVTRGRMMSEDEQRVQLNAVFIEDEVDGADLVTSLFAARPAFISTISLHTTLVSRDFNSEHAVNKGEEPDNKLSADDKDSITSPAARVARTRRLLEIIMLRGPLGYQELLVALESQGYDHVAYRLRNTDLKRPMSRFGSFCEPASRTITQRAVYTGTDQRRREASPPFALSLRDVTFAAGAGFATSNVSVSYSSQTSSMVDFSAGDVEENATSIDNRIKRIEDAWFILSRRVTRVEDNCTKATDLPEEELQTAKDDLAYLKKETLEQVRELIAENERKDAIIKRLSVEIEDRQAKLASAQIKIEKLEKRIMELEIKNEKSKARVRRLQACVEQQELRSQQAETRHAEESQELRLKLQEHQVKVEERDIAIACLQSSDADKESRLQAQEETLREQSSQLTENSRRLDQLAMLLHSHAQTGQLGSQTGSAKPNFCIGGNMAVNNILNNNNVNNPNVGKSMLNKNSINRFKNNKSKDNTTKLCRQKRF